MAEKSYLEMVTLVDTGVNNQWNIAKVYEYEDIVDFYLQRKKYARPQKYLTTALNKLGKGGVVEGLSDIHYALFRVDSALGDYRAAINHLRENNRLKDSIFNIARNNQLEELNIQYQTEEKEKDIKLARNKAKLDQVQLERTQNGRNWIIAGSGLLVIIVGLLYRQSRQRKKTTKIVTRQNEFITQKNELLQRLVTEKEWLLKEVHHRVKNNLHTVICLLESQATYLENDALKAIENSQHRIYAMSLIHQKLYQSDDIKTIDMSEYILELVKSLVDSFDVANQIHCKLDIAPIKLDISHAIPLGLIINEAITNSIKYAFPDSRKGEISISMVSEGTRIKLELADNGIGMPQIDNDARSGSLGLELMKGLSEDIDANISFEVDNGTKITIVFNADPLNNSHNLSAVAIEKPIYV
jgi:two-component system, sensor histidine kinase PdtaS